MVRKICCVAWIAAALTATAVLGQPIGIGSSNPGSVSHTVGSAIAKLLADELRLQTRVIPHGGQSGFIPAVNAGEVDFGIANDYELADAVLGKGIYEGQTLNDLRAVAILMPLRNAFWVAKDSPIKSIKDLKGKRVPGGWTQQKIIGYATAALLANAGLSYQDVEMIPVPNVNIAVDEFMQGKVDTFYFAMGAGKVREAGAKVGGIRALSVDPSPEAVARLKRHMPVMYPLLLHPSESNYGIVGPTYVGAMDFVLLTNKKVRDDLVYKVTKTLHGGKKAFLSSFQSFGSSFSPDKMAKALIAGEYHPGAISFYQEVGQWPPK